MATRSRKADTTAAPVDPRPAADDPMADLVDRAARLQGICLEAGITVALAESCTGGLVSHTLTEVPGSSGYVLGGVVPYSDAAKVGLLDVPQDVLAAHGAVSAQVARAMADGARSRLGADLAAAVTGIAGPDGGTDAKPVGLTYIAVADEAGVEVRRFVWADDRSGNKRASVGAALDMLIARAESRAESRAATGAGSRGAGSVGADEAERPREPAGTASSPS